MAFQPFYPQRIANIPLPYMVFPEGREVLTPSDYHVYAAVHHQDAISRGAWKKVWRTAVPPSFAEHIGLPWTSGTNRSESWARLFAAGLVLGEQGAFTVAKLSLFGRLPQAFFRYVSPQGDPLEPNELRALGWLAARADATGMCDTAVVQLCQQLCLGETTISKIRVSLERKGILRLQGGQKIQLMSLQQLGLYEIATESFEVLCEWLNKPRMSPGLATSIPVPTAPASVPPPHHPKTLSAVSANQSLHLEPRPPPAVVSTEVITAQTLVPQVIAATAIVAPASAILPDQAITPQMSQAASDVQPPAPPVNPSGAMHPPVDVESMPLVVQWPRERVANWSPPKQTDKEARIFQEKLRNRSLDVVEFNSVNGPGCKRRSKIRPLN